MIGHKDHRNGRVVIVSDEITVLRDQTEKFGQTRHAEYGHRSARCDLTDFAFRDANVEVEQAVVADFAHPNLELPSRRFVDMDDPLLTQSGVRQLPPAERRLTKPEWFGLLYRNDDPEAGGQSYDIRRRDRRLSGNAGQKTDLSLFDRLGLSNAWVRQTVVALPIIEAIDDGRCPRFKRQLPCPPIKAASGASSA